MGIDYHDARMLLEARLRGASFENTATVAHLALNLHPAEIASLQRVYRAGFPGSAVRPLENYQFGDYSDQFLTDALGVTALTIIDYSPYEGANLVHDLNQPVPEELWGRFDSIIEAGSLEHIFNFPVAITSLMKMVKVGGSIFITTPANNCCGHGFYQFNPEVMFRIFTQESGFELNRVAFLEAEYPPVALVPKRNAYEVADPAQVRRRVGLAAPAAGLLRHALEYRNHESSSNTSRADAQERDRQAAGELGGETSRQPRASPLLVLQRAVLQETPVVVRLSGLG